MTGWDVLRAETLLVGGVLAGMSVAVIVLYYRAKRRNAQQRLRSIHVWLLGTGTLVMVAAISYNIYSHFGEPLTHHIIGGFLGFHLTAAGLVFMLSDQRRAVDVRSRG